MSELYAIDEHNLRRLYHLGYMDCMEGRYNMPANGLRQIECELLVSAACKNTRWHELFGTPERAARTLERMPCAEGHCDECPIHTWCDDLGGDETLLEWLIGEGE